MILEKYGGTQTNMMNDGSQIIWMDGISQKLNNKMKKYPTTKAKRPMRYMHSQPMEFCWGYRLKWLTIQWDTNYHHPKITETETCHPNDRKMKIAIKIFPFQGHSQTRLIEITRNKLKDLST